MERFEGVDTMKAVHLTKRLRRIAADRDKVIMDERAAAAPALEAMDAPSAEGFAEAAEDAQNEA